MGERPSQPAYALWASAGRPAYLKLRFAETGPAYLKLHFAETARARGRLGASAACYNGGLQSVKWRVREKFPALNNLA